MYRRRSRNPSPRMNSQDVLPMHSTSRSLIAGRRECGLGLSLPVTPEDRSHRYYTLLQFSTEAMGLLPDEGIGYAAATPRRSIWLRFFLMPWMTSRSADSVCWSTRQRSPHLCIDHQAWAWLLTGAAAPAAKGSAPPVMASWSQLSRTSSHRAFKRCFDARPAKATDPSRRAPVSREAPASPASAPRQPLAFGAEAPQALSCLLCSHACPFGLHP